MRFIFVFLLLFAANGVFAQSFKSETDQPVRLSNVVLIKSTESDQDLFKKAGQELIAEGYTIDKSDANFFSIVTKHEEHGNYIFKTTITVAVLKGVIIIRGKSTSGGFSFPALYGKPKWKAVDGATFRLIDDYGKALLSHVPGGSIVYAVE